jgi:proteasome lid subunit RPN8/RPN11
MPVKELGPPYRFTSWRVPQFPRVIEYPLEVMEEIRAFACDELLQLSHGGDEVAGVLFGTRREEQIRILTWRPIACDHSQGEGLRLSYNDRMNLAVQLEVARQNPDLRDLRPVGWFVSHVSGGISLSPSDLEIYNGFFPEGWQAALVIRPKGSGLAEAGFFLRGADYQVSPDASYHCFDLEPLRLAPAIMPEPVAPVPAEPAPAVEPEQLAFVEEPVAAAQPEPVPMEQAVPVPAAQPAPVPVVQPVLVEEPAPAEPPPAPVFPTPSVPTPSFQTPSIQTPSLDPPSFETPSFELDESVPTRERWLWAIPIVLALGIAAFLLNQRRDPSASSSIALRALSEAQTVQLVWDANSRAVRDSDSGEIEINDGGKNSLVSLTADQLRAGKLSYLPQSSDVGFVMTVHPANGDPIHDSTRLIAPALNPALNQPAQAPQLLPASPPPETASPPPPADEGALQERVRQLTAEVGKERERADELQNLVRILENRLGISSTAPGTQPHP